MKKVIVELLISIGAALVVVVLFVIIANFVTRLSSKHGQPDAVRINSGDHTLESYMKYMCEKECKCPSR